MNINVAIFPTFNDWLGNRLFDHGTSFESVYKDAFCLFRAEAANLGFNVNTWDHYNQLSDVQVAWFLDLPESRREYLRLKNDLPKSCYYILQILESPVIRPHSFIDRNHSDFDIVLHYDRQNNSRPNYIAYSLPYTFRSPTSEKSFTDRSGVAMLNSNRIEGLFAKRRSGLAGLPLFGRFVCGWHAPYSLINDILKNERYSYRRRLGRAAETIDPDFLHIYGSGWNGENISWLPLFPNRPYKCWKGKTQLSKLDICSNYKFVIAIENYEGSRGYISEKIFDAFCAGAVPVYLGDKHANETFGMDSYVDVTEFDGPVDLLNFLKSMPEKKWKTMREAGHAFLEGSRHHDFTNKAFASKALRALTSLPLPSRTLNG